MYIIYFFCVFVSNKKWRGSCSNVEYIWIFELVLVQSHASHTKDTHYVSKYNCYMYIVIYCNIWVGSSEQNCCRKFLIIVFQLAWDTVYILRKKNGQIILYWIVYMCIALRYICASSL